MSCPTFGRRGAHDWGRLGRAILRLPGQPPREDRFMRCKDPDCGLTVWGSSAEETMAQAQHIDRVHRKGRLL